MTDNPTPEAAMVERTPAQFFFEIGFGAAFAKALIANNMQMPFEFSDAVVEGEWEMAGEAYDDPEEFDAYLARANGASPPPVTGGEGALREAAEETIRDAMMDSQYLAGVTAGWNAAQADDPNEALARLQKSREGHLAGLKEARAVLAATGGTFADGVEAAAIVAELYETSEYDQNEDRAADGIAAAIRALQPGAGREDATDEQ